VGEGVVPVTGISSQEVFELENHPTTSVSPIVGTTATTQGYDDSSPDSTFGHPNLWTAGSGAASQSFYPYAVGGLEAYSQWAQGHGLSGDDALRFADPDDDGRDNGSEYAYGGNPTREDAAYPLSTFAPGGVVTWSYVRRSDDPTLVFRHEASLDLVTWTPVAASSTTETPYAADSDFAVAIVQFDRPVPAPMTWFLRAIAE
jgi:hypothetical protein